jgi:hypothetical protein
MGKESSTGVKLDAANDERASLLGSVLMSRCPKSSTEVRAQWA